MTNDTQISDREIEILRLVATGATNQQIADQLNISVNTVKVHLRNIFGKIGAVSRTEATVYAIRNGLVPGLAVPPDQLPPEPEPVPLSGALSAEASNPAPALTTPATSTNSILEPPQAHPAATARRRAPPLLWLGAGLVVVLAAAILWRVVGNGAPLAPTSAATNAQAESSPTGRWIAHTALPRPRDSFAIAAYDPEGRLFVIGGLADGKALAMLDRYDPQTGRWVSLADKPTAVSHAHAISLRGRIYMPGGETNDGPTATFEAYDPREQSWEVLPPLPAPRSRYALAVWEGKIYLMGGWDGRQIVGDVFVYDPESERWSDATALPTPRQDAGATAVAGQIYLMGGEGDTGPLSEGLRLDPSGGKDARWERIAPMPQPVTRPTAIAVINSL
ncbi:MAG: LuxR family transcriptional regulator, partial [Chloroflexales bacterium]|nr:LuxR family transcriptional regulator [Chloroflexales bacterium]